MNKKLSYEHDLNVKKRVWHFARVTDITFEAKEDKEYGSDEDKKQEDKQREEEMLKIREEEEV